MFLFIASRNIWLIPVLCPVSESSVGQDLTWAVAFCFPHTPSTPGQPKVKASKVITTYYLEFSIQPNAFHA